MGSKTAETPAFRQGDTVRITNVPDNYLNPGNLAVVVEEGEGNNMTLISYSKWADQPNEVWWTHNSKLELVKPRTDWPGR